MAAMVVLALALFAVLSVHVYTLRSTTNNEMQHVANTIACEQMSLVESILKLNFRAPAENIQTPVLQSLQFPEFRFQVFDLGFEDAGQSLRAVAVRVNWNEGGIEHSYELSCTFYDY